MQYQNLVRKAWQLTQEHHYLTRWGVLASIFTLLVGLIRVRYFFTDPAITLGTIWEYLNMNYEHPVRMIIIIEIIWWSIYLLAFIIHNLSDGALIGAIAKIEDQKVRLSFSKSLSIGLNSFLRITEYNAVTSIFKVGNFIIYIFLLRFWLLIYMDGWDFLAENYIWLSALLIFLSFFTLLITYGEYDLVIHKHGPFKAIRNSITLVTFHLGETLLMMMLVLLISIRAIINILLVFFIPAAVASIIGYLTLHISQLIAVGVGVTIGMIIFWFAVKIAGALHVFTTAVWTLTYMDLDSRQDHKILANEKDDIEED
ncbi:MAG: hypothetical protein PHU71_06370 [Candidatus Gracilibacteria bacterium]|nr:hypothetical protein [Candidatus Gracilibacteria bacterium]